MSKFILWLQLIGLKDIKKRIVRLGKVMNRFATACNREEFYPITGHKIDLSTELDLMRSVLAGVETEIKRIEEVVDGRN